MNIWENTKITWHYIKVDLLNCKRKICIDLQSENPEVKNLHNHPRDEVQIKVTKCILKMKDQGTSTSREI